MKAPRSPDVPVGRRFQAYRERLRSGEPAQSSPASTEPAEPVATPPASEQSVLIRHLDVAVVIVGMLASGVAAAVGVAHVAWYWLFGLGSAITGVGAFAADALEATEPARKLRSLWFALGLSLGMLAAIVAYHRFFDPATREQTWVEMVVTLPSDAYVLYPQGKPGDSDQFAYPPLTESAHVWVDCMTTGPDGTAWYRIATDHSFIPAASVQIVKELSRGHPTGCA